MILLDYLLIPAFVYVLMAVALETLVPGVDRGVWIVLMVFSGMSALAVEVGAVWLVVGLIYGAVLKSKRRQELHVPL